MLVSKLHPSHCQTTLQKSRKRESAVYDYTSNMYTCGGIWRLIAKRLNTRPLILLHCWLAFICIYVCICLSVTLNIACGHLWVQCLHGLFTYCHVIGGHAHWRCGLLSNACGTKHSTVRDTGDMYCNHFRTHMALSTALYVALPVFFHLGKKERTEFCW